MENKVEMRLLKFNFTELVFKLNDSFVWPNGPVSLEPVIEKRITKIDENKVKISLFFSIKDSESKPFDSKVTLVGVFECLNWEKNEVGKLLVTINTVNILFPYLRQAVSNLTTLAGVPPYILPIINTQSINEKKE